MKLFKKLTRRMALCLESLNHCLKMLFRLVKKATGLDPVRVEGVAGGYDNEVYFVKVRGEKSFVVRVKKSGETSFKQEAWPIERCREVGVPVPRVFLVDEMAFGGESVEVMVQSRVLGKPLH